MDSIDELNGDRSMQFSRALSGLELGQSEISEVLRASQNYEHFRVTLVRYLAHRIEIAGKVEAHWREHVLGVAEFHAGKGEPFARPSLRQFHHEAKPVKGTEVPTVQSAIPAAAFQRKLLSALGCPITRGSVEIIPTVLAADAVRDGLIVSPRLGRVVGCIKNFQIDFVRFHDRRDLGPVRSEILAGNLPQSQLFEDGTRLEGPFSDFFRFTGDWRPLDDKMLVTDCTSGKSSIHFSCSAPVTIHFNAHPWSAIVEIFLNGTLFSTVDLFEPHTTVPRPVTVPIDAQGGHSNVEIRTIGKRNSLSMGKQCLFCGCSISDGTQVPIKYEKGCLTRGAKFDQRFGDMLTSVPVSGLVLDVGGGNRQLSDPRYINLDYAPYTEPDVIGDALHLPFKDGVIDLVYSTGVFEHLRDPIAAAQEIYRVTKPGGRILIGIAFMQPIHSEGQHFFNCTPWGIQELFKQFEINDISWEGSLSFLVEWMLRTTHLDRLVPKDEIAPVLKSIKHWDTLIEYERLKYIANGVWCVGTKAP
jgi:SAM-dependent methyltransferase